MPRISNEELCRLQIEGLEVIVSQGLEGGYDAKIISGLALRRIHDDHKESRRDLERLRGMEKQLDSKGDHTKSHLERLEDYVIPKIEQGDCNTSKKEHDHTSDVERLNVPVSFITSAAYPFEEEKKEVVNPEVDSDFDSLFDETDQCRVIVEDEVLPQSKDLPASMPHSVAEELATIDEDLFLKRHFRGTSIPRDAIWEFPGIIFFRIWKPETRKWVSVRKIDSDYLKDHGYIGEIPGFPVGWWWSSRWTLHRDGVHRSIQGGIAGSADTGATSILLNGGYTEDLDNGDKFLYTGSGGKNNNNKRQIRHQEMTGRNNALRVSWLREIPVRVVRGKDGFWPGRPKNGFRYDGLYKITNEPWETTGNSGYKVYMFEFRRCPGQIPIDTSGHVARSNGLYGIPSGYPRPVYPRK